MNLLISILIAMGVNITPATTTLDDAFIVHHQVEINYANEIIVEHSWHYDNTVPGGVVIDDDAHN